MSRTARTANRPSRAKRKPPAPPPGGWRPMEAAEILCPDAAALYRQGGEALEAAISQDLHRLSAQANRSPEMRPDAWLTLQLLDALRRRPDLQLTGRNPYDPLAPRTRGDGGCAPGRLRTGQRRRRHLPPLGAHRLPRWPCSPAAAISRRRTSITRCPRSLADVLIEASERLAGAAGPPPPATPTRCASRSTPPKRGKEWLLWRVRGLAEGHAPADRRRVLGDGQGALLRRYPARRVLQTPVRRVAGVEKPGPRGPRNSARAGRRQVAEKRGILARLNLPDRSFRTIGGARSAAHKNRSPGAASRPFLRGDTMRHPTASPAGGAEQASGRGRAPPDPARSGPPLALEHPHPRALALAPVGTCLSEARRGGRLPPRGRGGLRGPAAPRGGRGRPLRCPGRPLMDAATAAAMSDPERNPKFRRRWRTRRASRGGRRRRTSSPRTRSSGPGASCSTSGAGTGRGAGGSSMSGQDAAAPDERRHVRAPRARRARRA